MRKLFSKAVSVFALALLRGQVICGSHQLYGFIKYCVERRWLGGDTETVPRLGGALSAMMQALALGLRGTSGLGVHFDAGIDVRGQDFRIIGLRMYTIM